MAIEAGRTLQHYRLVEKLGEGGMGQVWRARDDRLERDVAIKILPTGQQADEHLLARFEREGKAISALNHPHICTVHDVGRDGDIRFLVMERIEGESLTARLRKGALPLDQVLELGAQIASALDAAHRLGIVHRDLKPDNVMLTRSGAKLLDFGLAKSVSGADEPIQGLTSLPTRERALTTEGAIVGTFQYMAPEQLEGVEVDARTDIFAFGAMLYEMATGRPAFEGKTKTSLIAAIVASQPPPIANVRGMAPPALDHLVRKCLEKAPEDRWQSAGDLAAQLRFIATAGSQPGIAPDVAPPRRSMATLPWWIAAVLAVLSISLAVISIGREQATPRMVRASISPPPGTALIPYDLLGVALSPDGRRLALAAIDADGGQRLWTRDLDSMTAVPIAETGGASYPFWSPDGTQLGFFADGKLKKIDLRGGSPRELADAPSGRGGSWGPDDTILFSPKTRSSIYRIPAAGGTAQEVTQFHPEIETTHRWPHMLPDGRSFLYVSRTIVEGRGTVGRLMLGSLDPGEPRVLIENSTNAVYVAPGYIVFGREGDLLAQPFDTRSLEFAGEAVPLATTKLSYWEAKNFVVFTASDDGTIVYLPEASGESELRWFDRTGRPLGTIGKPDHYIHPRVSFDGSRVAFVRGRPQSERQDLWVIDLEYHRETRLTQRSGDYSSPRWTRDGTEIAFNCRPKSVEDLCIKAVGEGGDVEVLHESSDWSSTGSFTPDGRAFLFSEQSPETSFDIWILSRDGKEPTPLLRTPFTEQDAEVSPDGRWFLFMSGETGRDEIYVRELKETSQQWQLSVAGGRQPRWRADGREVYFISADGTIMAVSIETGPSFRAGAPRALFTLSEKPDQLTPLFADITPDGERVLVNLPIESRTSVGFHAVLNWHYGLGR
ncbi:MAG TPA: protein kinase [Candidatus Polarisedimenticolia bacterium]|nr:protein kinase [Candidatus Polarisedimenticolia bacterium]